MAEEPVQLTVITLMYNTGREVIETIQSVHDEGYSGAVHEVFDDCSTDDSVELVSSFIENRNIPCILHRNTENLGINENKKRALKTVKGVLILGLSDDLIYLEEFKRTWRFIIACPFMKGIEFSRFSDRWKCLVATQVKHLVFWIRFQNIQK